MAHHIPSFWPESPSNSLRIVLALHGERRLTVVKEMRDNVLTDYQRESLMAIGFQQGQEGRWIAPFELEGDQLERVSKTLASPLVVFGVNHLVTLKTPSQSPTPAIPMELRDAIGWWFKKARRELSREIEIAESKHAESNPEKGSKKHAQTIAYGNPDRVRLWVEQALSGELNEKTEPVIGLGISRLEKLYKGDLPDDIRAWKDACAEFRGDETESRKVISDVAALNSESGDLRPKAGERVKYWEDENHREAFGTVLSWSDQVTDAFFVMPDNPEYLTGMAFPLKRKVVLSEIRGEHLDRLDDIKDHLSPELAEPEADNPADETQWAPATIQVEDIPSPQIRNINSKSGLLSEKARDRLAYRLLCRSMTGRNPLFPGAANIEIEHVFTRHAVSGDPELRGHDDDAKARRTEAAGVVRDLALDWFNGVQPTIPDAHAPVLSVIPIATSEVNSLENPTPEDQAKLEGFVGYGIGFHPKFIWRLHDQLKGLQKAYESDPSLTAEDRLKGLFSEQIEELIHGKHQEFFNLSSMVPSRWLADGVRFTKEYLFEAPDEAKAALQDRFFRGQGIDRQAIENNERAISLIANLSDQNPKAIENVHHPLFWLLDQAEKQGDLPRWSRATALAALNIDLTKHTRLCGELAMASGVKAVHTTTAVIKDRLPESVETTASLSHRAHVHTMVLKGAERKHLFTLGVYSKHETRDDRVEFFEGLNGTHRRSFARDGDKTAYASDPNATRRLNAYWEDAPSAIYRQEATALSRWLQMMLAKDSLDLTSFPSAEPITNELCDDMKVNWLAAENLTNLAFMDVRYDAPSKYVKPMDHSPALEDLPEFYSRDEANNILMDIEKGLQDNAARLIHTLSSEWLGEKGLKEKLNKGIHMWMLEQPHFQKLAVSAIERIAEEYTDTILRCPSPEGLVVATRATSTRVFHPNRVVTTEDVAKAGFDRKQAMEMELMKAKNGHRTTRGVRGAIFDAMAVLSPTQREELARMQDAEEKASRDALLSEDNKGSEDKTDNGKRVNTGVVFGLSAKDLRGKVEDVINSIERTTLESQEKLMRKTKLWPAPDWVALRSPEDGSVPMEPSVAYIWDKIRKNMVSQPPANTETANKLYARMALLFRDELPKYRTISEFETNGIPKLLENIEKLSSDAESAGLRPHKLFGDEIGGSMAKFYVAAQYPRHAHSFTDGNARWPSHLGKARGRQRMAADQDGPKTGAMPMLKKLIREGEDYRAGRDVTEDELVKTFAFSGVEYGESMSQKERTIYLNHAYDGFMDMARTLKVEPQALSLGGTLGLAFGSRGRGGRRAALAHFEPSNNVINLTREKGAGSMAHEYGHAMANYFYRQTNGVRRGEGDIMAKLNAAAINGIGERADIELVTSGGVRKEIMEVLDKIRTTINFDPEKPGATELLTSAKTVDYQEGKRSEDSRYWSSPEELFARTFETWVSYRLKSLNESYRNDFLVRNDKLETWGSKTAEINSKTRDQKLPQLYPTGRHLERLDQAFRELFATVKTENRRIHHEHLGEIELPHMYSHDGSIERLSPKEMGPLAFCAIREIARMCGDKVNVRFQSEILNSDGKAKIAGRFRLLEGDDPNRPGFGVKGLIEFSHHMNLSAIYHEGFHYAQHCLFTQSEQSMLEEAFAPGSPMFERLAETLIAQGKQHLLEHLNNPVEVQAYAFQEWVAGRLKFEIEDQPTSYFGEIKSLGQRIASTTQEAGFRNPEALFRAFYAGDLQRRADLANTQSRLTESENRGAGVNGHITEGSKNKNTDVPTNTNPSLSI